jgi:succinyl-CoA synthetase beta subunit
MDLFEFEGKRILASFGIPVPQGEMVYDRYTPAPVPFPLLLKAQVAAGGRGKAGGIRICRTEADYAKNIDSMFGMDIKGHAVNALLAVPFEEASREWYVSITLQGSGAKPLLMASPMGGVDIEEAAETKPGMLLRAEIEPFVGIKDYQIRRVIAQLGVSDKDQAAQLTALLHNLYRAFTESSALLMEINPLGMLGGKIMALDAKVVLDDNSKKAVPELFEDIRRGREKIPGYKEAEHESTTITFVPLEGRVALIADGAGTGMLSMDLVTDAKGSLASFCELGGTTNSDVMYRAMELTLPPGFTAKSLLIVLIGGFNRMDEMAEGISRYLTRHAVSIPVFTRMCGTREEEGKAIMGKAGLLTYSDLAETVKLAVDAAGIG